MILSSANGVGPPLSAPAEALGPLGALLRDPDVTEIMVNGPGAVYVERAGHVQLTDWQFEDENHLLRVIDALIVGVNRRVSFADPVFETRLPDGSRLTVALPPVAVDGPMITIRKRPATSYEMEDLLRFGSLSREAAGFLQACVQARANLLISGGSSSGKTTLLNVLSSFVAPNERIVTIEEAAELRLLQEHVCRLESLLAGAKAVTLRDLVKLAVRMRPDRILVGEVRGGEALDMLQALNTGHEGAMSTIHANSARDALARLETLTLMAGVDLPVRAIRQQIRAAIDVVVHLGRLGDGSRRVISIVELAGMEDQTITMQEIFLSEVAEAGGSARGGTRLVPTGLRPRIMDKVYQRRVGVAEIERLFPPQQRMADSIDARRRESQPAARGGGVATPDRRHR
jgi:pilus assembly protein CpaF